MNKRIYQFTYFCPRDFIASWSATEIVRRCFMNLREQMVQAMLIEFNIFKQSRVR